MQRWQAEHTQDYYTVQSSHVSAHQPSCLLQAQNLSLRNLHIFLLAIENLYCKASHLLLAKRRLGDLCFACFLFASQNDCLNILLFLHSDDSTPLSLPFRRKNPQCNLLLPTTFSVPEHLYILRIMPNNCGLLWYLATAAFFLVKDQKKDTRTILLTIQAHCIKKKKPKTMQNGR